MKRFLPVLIALLILLSSTVGVSADFQKGFDAYIKKDYLTALREFEPLVKQGHIQAQHSLGVMSYKGYGLPKNDQAAVKWFTLAAEQGHAIAQKNLGEM